MGLNVEQPAHLCHNATFDAKEDRVTLFRRWFLIWHVISQLAAFLSFLWFLLCLPFQFWTIPPIVTLHSTMTTLLRKWLECFECAEQGVVLLIEFVLTGRHFARCSGITDVIVASVIEKVPKTAWWICLAVIT